MDGAIRNRFERWGATPLGRWVKDRLDRQIERYLWSFFKDPYQTKKHREPFALVLQALVEDRDGESTHLGRRLRVLLDAIDSPMAAAVEHNDHQVVREARWLQAFFEDEPEWRGRLRAMLQDSSKGS